MRDIRYLMCVQRGISSSFFCIFLNVRRRLIFIAITLLLFFSCFNNVSISGVSFACLPVSGYYLQTFSIELMFMCRSSDKSSLNGYQWLPVWYLLKEKQNYDNFLCNSIRILYKIIIKPCLQNIKGIFLLWSFSCMLRTLIQT